jgi:hypothetical protein
MAVYREHGSETYSVSQPEHSPLAASNMLNALHGLMTVIHKLIFRFQDVLIENENSDSWSKNDVQISMLSRDD